MIPAITGIDHVHVYVSSWAEGEDWYGRILGYKRVDALASWAVNGGPLTVESPDGNVHLALFESAEPKPISAIAFRASAQEWVKWKAYLDDRGIELRVTDHRLAWSLYFHDPWGNMHEITTYEHEEATSLLAAEGG